VLAERPLSPEVKDLLMSQEPFAYAHLIKFERPSRPDSNTGLVSTAKQRYTYITDASRDVVFDDGSTDLLGNSNGSQTYIANKVLKVSSVQENTEAKASSYSLVLDGNGLGAAIASVSANITEAGSNMWDITLPARYDILSYGFREGDKINIVSGSFTVAVNISKFRAQNIVRVSRIDSALPTGTNSISIELVSEEIVSILLDKNGANYSSFINREVYIYRAYFQEGNIVGIPFLLFKGIISGAGFDDDDAALTVTWNLTSHWGDFSQVKGRITSDDFHRALDQNGIPQPQSALKTAYAYDKGFNHAETSINILADYTVKVEKQDVKTKKGFLGIGAKVKVKKYFVDEKHNTELDFQLQAKSIPVIYGVRNTTGIPVFADTLANDSSTVITIQALSEGEIGGIYDSYIDGNSLICNDKADFDARSTQKSTDTVQLICRGRADRGDVLGGTASISTAAPIPFYDVNYSNGSKYFANTFDPNILGNYQAYVEPTVTTTDNTGSGVFDGQSIKLTSPQEIVLDIFSGKPGQKAASSLVSIAKSNNFKIQQNYWNGIDTADYWGPNHRLLDTAYVVGTYKIKEGETTLPSVEFIVRGKTIDCYNYDKSYSHFGRATTENADNFQLGDYVDLKKADGTLLLSSVQIIDKWTFRNTDGTANTRFRYSVDPPLQYANGVPSITKFMMVKGSNTWTMITYNYKESQGANTVEWITPVTSTAASNGYVQFSFQGGAGYAVGGDPLEDSSAFSVVNPNGYPVSDSFFTNAVLVGPVTNNSIRTKYNWSLASTSAQAAVGKYLVRRNVVTIPGAVQADGYYNGYKVTLTRTDVFNGRQTSQTKTIIDYRQGIATIDGLWDYGFHPKAGDDVSITPAYADSRVSTNTAMQLMDYICSPTYGRGLNPTKDLNFLSWLTTARSCDTQSNVTVQLTGTTAVTNGAVYRWPASGQIIWQGTVLGYENDFVEFTNILGKLTYAWNSWRSYKVNELVYVDNVLYKVITAGVIPTKPTGATPALQVVSNSLTLTKVSGAGPATLPAAVNGNPVRALKNGSIIPGYSLYDADGIDYWRYIGWDEFDQRYVTQHQTNIIVDTSLPLFDNVNSFLDHFGGILRYSGGQYYLELEEAEGAISSDSTEPRNITADHIIGKIRLTDEGAKSAYNSLTAAYADPANKFESRNISFFNSDYLKADKNVPKKGNVTVPGITNYYNTRLLADRTLNKSRFGLQVSFNMTARGTVLLAGQVVQLQYPRYDWQNKKFRILSLTHQEDATVDIVAEEYDDSFYGLSNISKQAGSGLAGNNGSLSGIGSPYGLVATGLDAGTETTSGVSLTWVNDSAANTKNVSTEVYSSYSSYLYLTVVSIQNNILTLSQNPHKLRVGELITSQATIGGLEQGKSYFIASVPTPNTIQLSETKGGPILGFPNNSNVDGIMMTATLIGTVAIPANSYMDVFGGIDGRVVKYYWIRHKVVQGT